MESLTNLFKSKKENTNTQEKSVPKPEKSQEELRSILESKIQSLKTPIEELIKEYQTSLEDGKFDNQEDEEEGKGEERKMSMQKKLNSMLDKVEKMKAKLDSNEILPSYAESIEASYTFLDKRGRVEKTEQINLNIEQKLNEYISFYDSHGVEIPDNFEEDIKDIWEANLGDMRKQIETHGFNEILLIPPTPDLSDLAQKIKETEYFQYHSDYIGNRTAVFNMAQSLGKYETRIVLTHNTQNLKDHPELAKTLNTKGQDVPLDKMLSLEEYLILCKKYFEETLTLSGGQAGCHLDVSSGTWLATRTGGCLVHSVWNEGEDYRYVVADKNSLRIRDLGYRPSCRYTK